MWPPSLVDVGLAAGALVTLITLLMSCVCGCKNNNPKSELVGTAGVVTLRCEEDIPSPAHTTPESIKRASGQNSQRSLPEIPHVVVRHDNGDTASDIYATVGLDQNIGMEVLASAQESDHPYEHAYAKLQDEFKLLTEVRSNPAMVPSPSSSFTPGPSMESQVNVSEAVLISASVAISGQLPSSQELPYITSPSPPPPAEAAIPPVLEPHYFSGDSTDSTKGYTSISVREPLSQIRATLTHTHNDATRHGAHPHYATVSDDSDEMYAAIEEPAQASYASSSDAYTGGSETYAQIQPLANQQDTNAVVETDRRIQIEAAATHEEPTQTTHSRQASLSSTTNMASVLGSPKPEKRQANSPLPPPPALPASHAPLQNGKNEESPQHASFSTRQQRISSTGDLNTGYDRSRRSLNEKHQRNNSCVSSSDFYGCNYHVDTQRFSSGDLASRHLVAKELHFSLDTPSVAANAQHYNSIDKPCDFPSAENSDSLSSENRPGDSPSRNVEEMYAKVVKKGKALLNSTPERDGENPLTYDNIDSSASVWDKSSSHNASQSENTSTVSTRAHVSKFLSSKNEDPGYETIDKKNIKSNSYVTAKNEKKTLISIDPQDPGYETVGDLNRSGAIVSSLDQENLIQKLNHIDRFIESGPDSIMDSDPGYEHIRKHETSQSDSDPNYEVLRPQPSTPPYATIASMHDQSQVDYSVVQKKQNKYQNDAEPYGSECNYESMPHELLYTTSSESDSNYESVKPKDPNYESVKYFETLTKDPPYERVHNNGSNNLIERSDSGAGYEKLNPVTKPDAPNIAGLVTNRETAIENTVEDYFQV